MGVYDNFADSPNAIKQEGQEITLSFKRLPDNVGRITWNIPPPANGCNSDTQAYNGIVVTISPQPANYITTSPVNGVFYNDDPTADYELHSADKITENVYVIGAFYDDKTTTTFDITGISPKTAYYVSAYAVDNVGRYHREGVHAYSIPSGIEEHALETYPAVHEIELTSANPIYMTDETGLIPGINYTFSIKMECKKYTITIPGANAITYANLVDAINYELMLLTDPFIGPNPPYYNTYYFDITKNKLYIWNGYILQELEVIISETDPTLPVLGTYWLDTDTNVLYKYETSGWVEVSIILISKDNPYDLSCNRLWFDGTIVRKWDGNHWCDLNTIFSERNPQLPPIIPCNSYWFNIDESSFSKWNDVKKDWEDSLVLYYSKDPNTINTGDFWYDETDEKMKQFVGGSWNEPTGIFYKEPDVGGNFVEPPEVFGGMYWYIPSTQKFYERNLLNTDWELVEFISYPTDPRSRKSCDVWWNSSPSIDDVYVWEEVNNIWVQSQAFYKTSVDPKLPPLLPEDTAWVNPVTGDIFLIGPEQCDKADVIKSPINPADPVDNSVWFDGINYFVWVVDAWVPIEVKKSSDDPFIITDGEFWFNPETNLLSIYEYDAWLVLPYESDKNFLPKLGDEWYNSTTETLMSWNGSTWVAIAPYIKLEFKNRKCLDEFDSLIFSTRKTGCGQKFEILMENNILFSFLNHPPIYLDPIHGADGVASGPMYKQLGVGDDGSPDERRELHQSIRVMLGYPSIKVELTKQQIDESIDNALLMLRKHSSFSTKKALFFLELLPGQQLYRMTNRCVGFHKIVQITALHRVRAGAFKTAFPGNDNFAYAALQQMYTMGTFDILTFHMSASYIEELETLFASKILYMWNEQKRELKLYQSAKSKERILVEATIERTEQDLFTDRETRHWIKRYAVAEAKKILAQTRGKFVTLPGPNGATNMNADALQSQAETEQTMLMEELYDAAMQDILSVGLRAHYIIG